MTASTYHRPESSAAVAAIAVCMSGTLIGSGTAAGRAGWASDAMFRWAATSTTLTDRMPPRRAAAPTATSGLTPLTDLLGPAVTAVGTLGLDQWHAATTASSNVVVGRPRSSWR